MIKELQERVSKVGETEESKSASDKNDDVRELRSKEFLCNTKFSKLYQNLIPNKHFKAIQAD